MAAPPELWLLYSYRRLVFQCVASGGKCFASGQCCKGYVCAAFDDFYGSNPEIPGYCVKEKDLEPCKSSMECQSGKHCASVGRSRGRFCVERPDIEEEIEKVIAENRVISNNKGQSRGFPCKDDSDCAPFDDNNKRLCCQTIKRYRMKAKTICDIVTDISSCIEAKKRK